MIERGVAFLPGKPSILAKERAVVPCGCFVAVGLRLDTQEIATTARPCGLEHEREMALFNSALTESLDEPTGQPLVEVCDEILTMIFAAEAG